MSGSGADCSVAGLRPSTAECQARPTARRVAAERWPSSSRDGAEESHLSSVHQPPACPRLLGEGSRWLGTETEAGRGDTSSPRRIAGSPERGCGAGAETRPHYLAMSTFTDCCNVTERCPSSPSAAPLSQPRTIPTTHYRSYFGGHWQPSSFLNPPKLTVGE